MEEAAKDTKGGAASNLLDGAALVIVSPIVVPALLLGLRPVAKTAIKGSLFLTSTVKQLATTTRAGWSEMVAEARATARPTTPPAAATASAEHAQPSQKAGEEELQRITGIGDKFAALLREAGVGSLRDLARRNPEHLHERLAQINDQQQIVSQVPALEQVTDWITQAQKEIP